MIKYLILLMFGLPALAQIPEVVNITSKVKSGSGYVIYSTDNTSVILTNDHVCSDNYMSAAGKGGNGMLTYNSPITVKFKSQDPKSAIIRAVDEHNDLCMLLIESREPFLILHNPSNLAYKEVLTLQAPDTYGSVQLSFIGQDNSIDEWSKWHLNSWLVEGKGIKHGQSGSPILNGDYQVVGMLWGVHESENTTEEQETGYMIDSDTILRFLNKVLNSSNNVFETPSQIIKVESQ